MQFKLHWDPFFPSSENLKLSDGKILMNLSERLFDLPFAIDRVPRSSWKEFLENNKGFRFLQESCQLLLFALPTIRVTRLRIRSVVYQAFHSTRLYSRSILAMNLSNRHTRNATRHIPPESILHSRLTRDICISLLLEYHHQVCWNPAWISFRLIEVKTFWTIISSLNNLLNLWWISYYCHIVNIDMNEDIIIQNNQIFRLGKKISELQSKKKGWYY